MCVYCICPGNQTATAARASWEGPSGAKREIQGNVPLLKQLQHLLQYFLMHTCRHPPSCPSHTSPLPQTLLHKVFNFNLCRTHSPSPTNLPSLVRLSSSPLPFPINILPCAVLPQETPMYTPVALQWYHNRHSSQKGRPQSAQGLKKPAKARTSQVYLKLSPFL